MAHQITRLKGLDHIKGGPKLDRPGNKIVPAQRGRYDHAGLVGQLTKLLQQGVAIHSRHDHIGNQDVKGFLFQQPQRIKAVSSFAHQRDFLLPAQKFCHSAAVLRLSINDQDPGLFHGDCLHY